MHARMVTILNEYYFKQQYNSCIQLLIVIFYKNRKL